MLSFTLFPAACVTGARSTQSRTSKPRSVSTLSNGELLFGVVAQVGGAASAWLDVGVATATGKPVNARLRLGKRKPPEIGTSIPVIVHRLNVPAARVEVRRPDDSNILPLTRRFDQLSTGNAVQARVRAFVPSGAVVDVGVFRLRRNNQSVRHTALLRRKHFAPTWASPLDKVRADNATKILAVGDQLDLFFREVHLDSCYLFVDAAPVTEKEVEAEKNERLKRASKARRQRRRPPLSTLEIGSEISGVVHNVVKFGVFVDVGVNTDGLIHYTDMGRLNWKWKDVFKQGMEVVVRVKTVIDDRLNLEFMRFEGEETDAETIHPALRRPQKQIEHNPPDGEDAHEEKVESDNGKDGSDSVDKFSDDYFEEKYLM